MTYNVLTGTLNPTHSQQNKQKSNIAAGETVTGADGSHYKIQQ